MLPTAEEINQMSQNTLLENLGMKVTEAKIGRVVVTMPVDKRHHQPFGVLHGGASVALAESACSLGANLIAGQEGKQAVGQEINANHIRPITSGILEATAEIVHEGKKSQVWEIKIKDQKNQKLICISRCTMAILD